MESETKNAKKDPYSCKRFIGYAVLLLALFGIAHLCGFREYTSVLSGTDSAGRDANLYGMAYALLYACAVIIAPILIIASLLLQVVRCVTKHKV